MRPIQIGLFATFLGLAVLGSVAAMPPGGHHDRGEFGPGMMGPPLGRVLHRLERLGIDDAQREQIEQILAARREASEQLREQLREQGEALREAAGSADYDAAQVRAMADELGASVSQMAVRKAETWQQLRAVLTTEQLAKLDEFRQRRKQRRGCQRD